MTVEKRWAVWALAVLVGCAGPGVDAPSVAAPTSRPVDPAIARIRDEGLNHSQVMATLDTLCNVIGPRLTASPNQVRASEWTLDQLGRWGLADAHLEPWGKFGRGWSVKRFSLQVVEPTAVDLIAVPKAWSPGLDGPVEADVVYVDGKTKDDLNQYKGKLKGKIVLIGATRVPAAHATAESIRMDDAELKKLADATGNVGVGELMRTSTQPASRPASRPSSRPWRGQSPFFPAALALAVKEGAVMEISPSNQGDGGTVYVAQAATPNADSFTTTTSTSTTSPSLLTTEPVDPTGRPSRTKQQEVWSDDPPKNIPQATMAIEQYNRIVSQLKAGEKVRVAAELQVRFDPVDPAGPSDTVAELPGTDLKDQVVMVGGHLDSWQGGTGATDNGAGAAAAMEAIRILKAAGLQPRRTIRVALWTGEEQGLLGSAGYVGKHFGKVDEPTTRPARGDRGPTTRPSNRPVKVIKGAEYEQLSAYFNLDNGTGRIRGVYAQGNRKAAELFKQWLVPVSDLGASTVTLSDTDSTDHMSFDAIGLPGFQFIQDPIEYGTRTHHSNADVYERLQADDLKQAATVMAVFLWDAANMDDRFPRKDLPRERR